MCFAVFSYQLPKRGEIRIKMDKGIRLKVDCGDKTPNRTMTLFTLSQFHFYYLRILWAFRNSFLNCNIGIRIVRAIRAKFVIKRRFSHNLDQGLGMMGNCRWLQSFVVKTVIKVKASEMGTQSVVENFLWSFGTSGTTKGRSIFAWFHWNDAFPAPSHPY